MTVFEKKYFSALFSQNILLCKRWTKNYFAAGKLGRRTTKYFSACSLSFLNYFSTLETFRFADSRDHYRAVAEVHRQGAPLHGTARDGARLHLLGRFSSGGCGHPFSSFYPFCAWTSARLRGSSGRVHRTAGGSTAVGPARASQRSGARLPGVPHGSRTGPLR